MWAKPDAPDVLDELLERAASFGYEPTSEQVPNDTLLLVVKRLRKLEQIVQKFHPDFDEAAAPYPTMDELRRASLNRVIEPYERASAEVVNEIRSTRRGRIGLWLTRKFTAGG